MSCYVDDAKGVESANLGSQAAVCDAFEVEVEVADDVVVVVVASVLEVVGQKGTYLQPVVS